MDRDEYSRRMQFEHELIDRRLTWLLTSESILFAAFGFGLDKSPAFLSVIAAVGLAISAAVFLGVTASLRAKYYIWRDFRVPPYENEPFWVRTPLTYLGMIPDLSLPVIFAIAWTALWWQKHTS